MVGKTSQSAPPVAANLALHPDKLSVDTDADIIERPPVDFDFDVMGVFKKADRTPATSGI
ncbi:MAG: hypothetical protein ACOX1P_17720 [Thermoguttaceae bacterium]|jgi:hypothetical protein